MRSLKDLTVVALGGAAALYLVYPSLAIFELLPDALPIVGSIDEASATLILASAFRYFGVDLAHLFRRPAQLPEQTQPRREP